MLKLNPLIVIITTSLILAFAPWIQAKTKDSIELVITIPKINENPYHKPYIAIWLEKPDRSYVTTIALWANDMEWYKDLRQWWRKAGRSEQSLDGVTGATKKPGKYKVNWSGKDANNQIIKPGDYILKIEASREEGGREFLKTPIAINKQGNITLKGQHELGPIQITTTKLTQE